MNRIFRHFCTLAAGLVMAACTVAPATQIPLPTAKVPSLFEVNSAIDRWQTGQNEDYFVSVEETDSTGTHLYRVVVVDGEIQAAQRLEQTDGAWQQPVAVDDETAAQYTIDALLDRVLRDVNGEGAAPLNMYVVFDDVAGFPTLVDAKAIQSYAEDGRIKLNREHSYTLSIALDLLLEDTFGLNKTPILTLTRSGGERAACSTLRIFTDGSSIYSDNCRQILLQLRPPADSFARLEALSGDLAAITETRTAGGESLQLTLHGTGSGSAADAESGEIWDLALDLDELLSRPIGEGITLLLREGDALVGFDLRTNLQQPATLDITPPLHGGIVDPAGRLLVYSDGSGLRWLDAVSGDTGTYFSHTAERWSVPVAVTGDGKILLNRVSAGGADVEWGWVSLEDRAWHDLPGGLACITAVAASPLDGRTAVMTGPGPACDVAGSMWIVDLAAGTAEQIVSDLEGASSLAWSADGEWLAFPANPGAGAGQVFLVHPDGTGLAALTDHESGLVTGLAWDSSGETLAYGLSGSEDAGREDGLYAVDPATGEVIRSLAGEGLTPIGFDATGEFLAFGDGSDLLVWVLAFGQVLPASAGGGQSGFVGFVGGGP